MIIDFHVHLAQRSQLLAHTQAFLDDFWRERGDWNEVLDPARLGAYLASEGVDWAVGLPEMSPVVTGECPNEYVLERFAAVPRLLLFASLNPYLTPRLGAEARRLAGLGFRGIKLYPTYQYFYPNDRILYPLYAECEALGWPVMVHTGSSIFPGARIKYGDPVHLDDVAVDFPGLHVLLVHGGRGFWYDRAEFLVQLHQNLHLEISGLPPRKLLDYFPNLERIHRKVVFGSDWPGNPGIRSNTEALRELPLSAAAKAAILGGNAARLLGLEANPT